MLLSQKSFAENFLELLDKCFFGVEETYQGANNVVVLRPPIFYPMLDIYP